MGRFKPQPDFHALDRLNAHHRLRQHAIQLAIPLRMAAQPKWQVEHPHFDNPAQCVPLLGCLIDPRDDRRIGLGVERVHRARIA